MNIKLLWFLLVVPSAYMLLLVAVNSWKQRVCSQLVYSIILAFVVTFFFNKLPSVVQEEQTVMQNFAGLKGLFQNQQAKTKFIVDNFIMINTAFDQVLLPRPNGDQDDKTVVNITDRRQLISFFRLCNQEAAQIDMVVCDIYFEQSTMHDAVLKHVMDSLIQNNKLVVSHNPFIKPNRVLAFAGTASGDVSASVMESVVFDYKLMPDYKARLPYLAYIKLNKLKSVQPSLSDWILTEKDSLNNTTRVINDFVPEMVFSEEDINENLLQSNTGTGPQTGQVSGPLTYNLSEVNSPINQQLLPLQLRLRKKNKQRNIVMVGAFGNTEYDMHATVYGQMHGITIVINVLYNLLNGRHRFSWLVFLLTTLVFFFIINSIIDIAIEREHNESSQPAPEAEKQLGNYGYKRMLQDIWHFIKYVFSFIFIEERFFWILVAFALAVNLIFNQFVNVLALAVHFFIFHAAVNYTLLHEKKKALPIGKAS